MNLVQQQFFSPAHRLTVWLMGVIIFFRLLSYVFPSFVDLFAYSPAKTFGDSFYLWQLVSGLVMTRFFLEAIILPCLLFLVGQTFEPLWGRYELLRFSCFVGVAVNFCILVETGLIHFFFPRDTNFYYCNFSGIYPVLFAAPVALKLHFPTRSVLSRVPFLQWFTYSELPFITVLVTIPFLLFEWSQIFFFHAFNAFIVSWVFLRYFHLSRSASATSLDLAPLSSGQLDDSASSSAGSVLNTQQEDLLASFTFLSLFPAPCQPYLRVPFSYIGIPGLVGTDAPGAGRKGSYHGNYAASPDSGAPASAASASASASSLTPKYPPSNSPHSSPSATTRAASPNTHPTELSREEQQRQLGLSLLTAYEKSLGQSFTKHSGSN